MNRFPLLPLLFVLVLVGIVVFNVPGLSPVDVEVQVTSTSDVEPFSTLVPTDTLIPTLPPTVTSTPTMTLIPTITAVPTLELISADMLFAERSPSDIVKFIWDIVVFARSNGCPSANMTLIEISKIPSGDFRYLVADSFGQYAVESTYLCGDVPSTFQLQVYARENWEDETGRGDHLPFEGKATKDWGLALIQYRLPSSIPFPMLMTRLQQDNLQLWHFCQLSDPGMTLDRPNVDWWRNHKTKKYALHYPSFGISMDYDLAYKVLRDRNVGGMFYAGWLSNGDEYTICLKYLK
jgi:hypothetical protein